MTDPALRWVESGTLKVLDFDIENRPLSYMGNDMTSGEVTVIAAGWATGRPRVECRVLEPDDGESMLLMLGWFRRLYDEADMVTGHYIRGHDLPMLNGAMLENGLDPLPAKLTSDTCKDLVKIRHIPKSQESLGEMLGTPGKFGMSQPMWRAANRLTDDGVQLAIKRAKADVLQHIRMRRALMERGLLGPPRMWRPM